MNVTFQMYIKIPLWLLWSAYLWVRVGGVGVGWWWRGGGGVVFYIK